MRKLLAIGEGVGGGQEGRENSSVDVSLSEEFKDVLAESDRIWRGLFGVKVEVQRIDRDCSVSQVEHELGKFCWYAEGVVQTLQHSILIRKGSSQGQEVIITERF
jgi:hypothetical protein